MKSTFYLILLILASNVLNAQSDRKEDWKAIDKRPVPAWFENAKFGIFIHWGIYFVPMWSPKGTYEEWYKYWLDNKNYLAMGILRAQRSMTIIPKCMGRISITPVSHPCLKQWTMMLGNGPDYSKNQEPNM